jgi:Phage tail assembly chaperone proteins, E, or 41 or 14
MNSLNHPITETAEEDFDPNVSQNDDGTLTYRLRFPVSVKYRQGSQERQENITELTFRRVTGADLRAIGKFKDDMDIMTTLFTRLSNTNPVIFDQLDAEDIERATKAISDFFPGVRKTGKTI